MKQSRNALNERGIKTKAKVTSKIFQPKGLKLRSSVLYEFPVYNTLYKAYGYIYTGDKADPSVGDTIDIIYLADDPKKSMTDWEFAGHNAKNAGLWFVILPPTGFMIVLTVLFFLKFN